MTSDRKAAIAVGVLYILGTVAGVVAALITPAIGPDVDVLAQVAANRSTMIASALLVLTMGFALSALAAVFYPIGRRFSESLATGYVIFRGALEGTVYVISTLITLVLVALSAAPSAALAPVATALMTSHGVIWNQLVSLPFGVGALMFYALLYRARLVPRWILVWGFAGATLFMAANLAHLYSANIDAVMGVLFVQELVLGAWLIAKGFDQRALAAAETQSNAPVARTSRSTAARRRPLTVGDHPPLSQEPVGIAGGLLLLSRIAHARPASRYIFRNFMSS